MFYIQKVEHIAKELVEGGVRGVKRRLIDSYDLELEKINNNIHVQGFAVIPNFWSEEKCRLVRTQVDSLIKSKDYGKFWVDNSDSDKRVYFAEQSSPDLMEFHEDEFIEKMRRRYTGSASCEKLTLAAKLDFRKGNLGSGGGWHRDSPHNQQFKAILYLSDVSPIHGPFQYMPKTHHTFNTIDLMLSGFTKPNQYRFDDEEIIPLQRAGFDIHTFCASAGTLLLVDTKGIHRGMPIQAGSRYALTLYTFDKKIPEGF